VPGSSQDARFVSSVWGIHDAQNENAGNFQPTGCGFFRIVLPLEQLKAHGWKAGWRAGTPPEETGEYRLLVGERLDRPAVLKEWRRKRLKHRLAYELDDDVWNVDIANWGAYRTYSRYSVQDTVEMAATISDLVTVTCEPLAEQFRIHTRHPNIKVIPNYIPEFVLGLKRHRNRRVTIGWAGGDSHTWDVPVAAKPVRAVMDKDPSLRLHVIGTDFRPTFTHVNARWTPWEDDPRNFYRHLDFDIGLAPIASSKFNESKSYLKCLEYAAMGIPVVASDFGPYPEFVVDGVTGFLVKTEKQWRDRIRELVADRDLRETMGAKARELAAQHTIEGNWHRWADAYEEILR